MPSNQPDDPSDLDPSDAFEELRREISLTRHAVEGLTAARERIPDYSATLGGMADALRKSRAALERIEESPAVRLTPGAMSAELIKASAVARANDQRMLHDAHEALSRSLGRVDGMIERQTVSADTLTERLWFASGGALAGALLWSVLPGAVARSLPEGWGIPEWMAARTLRMDQRAAGERMITTADAAAQPADN